MELFSSLKLPLFDGMAEAGNEVCAKNLKRKQQKRLNNALTGRKLMYKSKKKGSSGSVDKGFNILMVQTMMMMMMMS